MTTNVDAVLEAWKTTIEVQRHFNEIAIKIRNLAVTVLAALLSAAALSLREGIHVIGIQQGTPLALFLLVAALIAWAAFYVMDRFWYHRLLIGAVRHGEQIETRWKDSLPELGLTRTISEKSAIRLWRWLTPWRREPWEFRSTPRVDFFYAFGGVILIASIMLVANIEPRDSGISSGESTNSACVSSGGSEFGDHATR